MDAEGRRKFARYVGGGDDDFGTYFASFDSSSAYLLLETNSLDLQGPDIRPNYGGGLYDCFLQPMLPNGEANTIGVYIGGSGWEVCAAVLGTPEGAVLVVGSTNSPDFGSPAAGPGGFATLLEPPGRSGKVGDCNLDGDVTVSDVITAVNIGLGLAPLTRCQRADRDCNGTVTIDEIIAAVTVGLES